MTHILIIEDNDSDALFLEYLLSESGEPELVIHHCRQVSEARQRLSANKFDCVFLDYMLGSMKGTELLGELRESNNDVPIIIMTGNGSEKIAVNALKMGAQDYLSKDTWNAELVRRALAAAIAAVHYQREIARKQAAIQTFAYRAAHDLKSPVRQIGMLLEQLQADLQGRLTESEHELCELAMRRAARLERLIERLIGYAESGRRTRLFAPASLQSVLEQAMESLDHEISKSNAIIHSVNLPVVLGDDVLLVQVFQNALSNAIKFSTDVPEIVVTAKLDGNSWHVSIADKGIGMPESLVDQVFDPFYRVHSADVYEGSGIGLAICQQIIEQHEGKIWIESAPQNGTTVHFTLPDELSNRANA